MENNSCVIYNELLSEEANSALFNHTVSINNLFKSTGVMKNDNLVINESKRKSKVTTKKNFEEFYELLTSKIEPLIPEVLDKLQIAPFEIDDTEIHLTAHNNGDFYKPHRDNNQGGLKYRKVTFVYYFHSTPKMFSGGQLLFLENKPRPLIVEPINNSIVFFNSSLLHAVHPIVCNDMKFEHSRFTLNGWLRERTI